LRSLRKRFEELIIKNLIIPCQIEKEIAIVGVGLIGGSLALQLNEKGLAVD
jgi:NADPH-dependent 2,4-dienoyl-CoA reductase/sulfur reductase-like enzyme